MPNLSSTIVVEAYYRASDLPKSVWDFFAARDRHTNVMYPIALQILQQERGGSLPPAGTFWISCSTIVGSNLAPALEFVLSCTTGPQGAYPIFICTTATLSELHEEYIHPRIEKLVRELYATAPPERVYSVFGPEVISRTFAKLWSRYAGISLEKDPEYYYAKLTFCTSKPSPMQPSYGYVLRQATDADIPAVAMLCHGFGAVSEPFVLSQQGGIQEATYLVRNNLLWVYEVANRDKPSRIASMVAVTRSSESMAVITKTFTSPDFRNKGYAEQLVRAVCHRLLETKESVVIYVAHNNPAASKIFHRVGFRGLEPNQKNVKDVEDWLELGFDRCRVQLPVGHW